MIKNNEYYARRFGWIKQRGSLEDKWYMPNSMGPFEEPPDFAGDVSVMILECERHELQWSIEKINVHDKDPYYMAWFNLNNTKAETPALALAEALDSYLGEN